jgi:hypothetical protein
MEIAVAFRVYSGCRVRVRPDEKWRVSSTNPFLLLNEREHHENCYVVYGLPCTVLAVRRGGRRTGAATDAGGVDRNTRHLVGEPVDLTSREFALLEIFMQNVGRILSRKLICEKCWSSHYDHEANLLDVYMSRLRAKFEAIPGPPVFKTVRGVGYQLL